MNQVLNKIVYGLLTKEQKAGFCQEAKKRGVYEFYDSGIINDWCVADQPHFENSIVYRLKILPDEWYFVANGTRVNPAPEVILGSMIDMVLIEKYVILRPAKPHEIPKPVTVAKSLLERIQETYKDKEVVMLEWDEQCDDVFMLVMRYKDCYWRHIEAQSLKGFACYVYVNEDYKGHADVMEFLTSLKPVVGTPYDKWERTYDLNEPVHKGLFFPVAFLINK